MHEQFLPYLADPVTGEPLDLEVEERQWGRVWTGALVSSTARYSIIAGIPRFVRQDERESAQSFSGQWQRWQRTQFESANIGRPMEGHTRSMWRQITGLESARSSTIAEFGCGSGRFVDVAREHGAKVIGLDLSDGAEISGAQFSEDPNVLICQADILRPPIRPATLDGAYSIGVLHHTSQPRTGALRLCESVRPGGWIALSVYGPDTHYSRLNVELYRKLFRALWPVLGAWPALRYTTFVVGRIQPFYDAPVAGRILKAILPSIKLPDSDWSRLDTFDSITPRHQSIHTIDEVFAWAIDGGVTSPIRSDWGGAACRGVRT